MIAEQRAAGPSNARGNKRERIVPQAKVSDPVFQSVLRWLWRDELSTLEQKKDASMMGHSHRPRTNPHPNRGSPVIPWDQGSSQVEASQSSQGNIPHLPRILANPLSHQRPATTGQQPRLSSSTTAAAAHIGSSVDVIDQIVTQVTQSSFTPNIKDTDEGYINASVPSHHIFDMRLNDLEDNLPPGEDLLTERTDVSGRLGGLIPAHTGAVLDVRYCDLDHQKVEDWLDSAKANSFRPMPPRKSAPKNAARAVSYSPANQRIPRPPKAVVEALSKKQSSTQASFGTALKDMDGRAGVLHPVRPSLTPRGHQLHPSFVPRNVSHVNSFNT